MLESTSIQQEQIVMQQKPSMTSQMQGQPMQPQMQMHQQQMNMQAMQPQMQQGNFDLQSQIQPNVMNKHMFGEMPASDGGMLVPQQQQHPHFVGPMQQMNMQIDQPVPLPQQQKFLSRHEQSGIAPNISGNLPTQTPGKVEVHLYYVYFINVYM